MPALKIIATRLNGLLRSPNEPSNANGGANARCLSVKGRAKRRRLYDYYTGRNSAADCAWRAAHLALQQELGILPEQWAGLDCRDTRDSAAARAHLKERRLVVAR